MLSGLSACEHANSEGYGTENRVPGLIAAGITVYGVEYLVQVPNG